MIDQEDKVRLLIDPTSTYSKAAANAMGRARVLSRSIGAKAGLSRQVTPTQVQGLLNFYAGHQSQSFQSTLKGRLDDETQSIGLLQQEWGPSYDAKVAQAARAARYFGGQPLIEFLNQSGLGNNPELVRAFAKIGSMMTEDSLKIGRAQGFSITPEEARREAQKLMAKEAYTNRNHPEHASTLEHVQQLFERAYSDEVQ